MATTPRVPRREPPPRTFRGIALLVVALLVVVLPGSSNAASDATRPSDPARTEEIALALVNRARAEVGLPSLRSSDALRTSARAHSLHMAGVGAPVPSDDLTADLSMALDHWTRAGESVGMGWSPERLVEALLDSPFHRANLLGAYDTIGVGAVHGDERTYLTIRLAAVGETTIPAHLAWSQRAPGDEVRRLYLAMLGREPDSAGLRYWTEMRRRGLGLTTLAAGFMDSAEYRNRFGGLDESGFVDSLYRNIMEREPDADGARYWTQLLRDGLGRATLVVGFSESREFRSQSGLSTDSRARDWAAHGAISLSAPEAAQGTRPPAPPGGGGANGGGPVGGGAASGTTTAATPTTVATTTATTVQSTTATTPAAPTTTTTVTPTATTTTTAPMGTRDAFSWPFSSNSPWNVPIGSGARYESAYDTDTAAAIRSSVTPWVNAGTYSHPIYRATTNDPVATVTDNGRGGSTTTYRIPHHAIPANGTDRHLHVVDPTGRWLDETWYMQGGGTTWTAGYHVRTDLYGDGLRDGVRAYGGSAVGGLIRHWELDSGSIRHAIAVALTNEQLGRGPIWPATREDGNAGSTYSGTVPMGTLLAIPPNVDIRDLGLTRDGEVLARALQDYGGYVVDRAGAFIVYAEPSLEGTARLANLRNDLGTIRAELRVVSNNGPTTPGGGGTPRVAYAPPLG